MSEINPQAVERWLRQLQQSICDGLEKFEPKAKFTVDDWQRDPSEKGLTGDGSSRVLEGGEVFERGGVNFSLVHGDRLPPAATERNPHLAGGKFIAMGVSLVMHPRNPYVPTSHANVRFFVAEKEGQDPVWWFGGGFDLTPFYGNDEDCQHWHQVAKDAVTPFGDDVYPELKKWCDDYFYLKHRDEQRGIGGLFFDDWTKGGFEQAFAMTQAIGEAYLKAYAPIVERRKDTAYGEREREWQLVRRGRYVEFNLVYDRGTLFGLQSGGRTESILMSMPPATGWRYDYHPEAGSPEADLLERVIKPQAWV